MKLENMALDQRLINVGAGDGLFLSSDSSRIGLIISSPPTGTVTISFNQPAVLNAGLNMYAAGPAVVFEPGEYGNALTEEIRCIGSVGGQTIGVIVVRRG